jgi:ryanodine receptor 3
VKESLKSMLALGWSIQRTKEGEALFQQRESEKLKKSAEVPASPPVLISVHRF